MVVGGCLVVVVGFWVLLGFCDMVCWVGLLSLYVWAARLPRRSLRGCVWWAARDCVITGGSAENTQAIANPGWDGGNEVARMRIFAGTNRGGCGRHGRIRKGVRIDFVSR